jgi:hypothetical protein
MQQAYVTKENQRLALGKRQIRPDMAIGKEMDDALIFKGLIDRIGTMGNE